MVSIIKNQLLKHLSRYTKNLSSDKINLSTFRGEGELSNLQLDENVLTELLELPSWLRLTSAWCNHVSFRIHWTKLKSTPITLSLDEVNITVETCEFGRGAQSPPSGVQPITAPQGKYSFIHKVIDGITITVNTVNVKFQSPAFTASVQMSRIRVESKTPKWLHGDLRVTRLKDPARGLILIFKELSWQTVRIEASSTQDKNLTPLRLLTNQARCRITIKKKLSDCSVLSSRLVLILDDLLWVLTDSQLKAALHFADSLSGLIKASTHVTQKTKAQKKLENLPEYQAQVSQQSRHHPDLVTISSAQKSFNIFDVQETSYHFFSQRIDLHLCDDAGDGRSSHPDLKDGGALQVSVQGFQIDYYPYHLAKANRSHWPKYKEAAVPPALWLEQSLNVFRESLLNLTQPNRPPTHQPLERATNQPNLQQQQLQHHQVPGSAGSSHPQSPTAGTPGQSPGNRVVMDKLAKLMTSCVILRVEDFTMYRVTTSGKKQMPKEFISGDKDRFSFPPDLPTLHAEFTYFYYPGDYVYPLPPSKAYVYVNPVQIHFDLDSVLWFNSFALNLHESLLRTSVADSMSSGTPTNEPSLMYMDVKLEAIMPRILLEASAEAPVQRDRPKTMQVQISRFAVTNIREMGSSRADLAQALHSLQEGSLVFASGFPSKSDDLCIVTDRILSHVAATDVSSSTNTTNSPEGAPLPNTSFSSNTIMSRYALWDEPRDVWCCKIDPIWIDFFGAKALGQNKAMPFIDAVPITLWLHGKNVRPEKFIPPMSPSNVASINNPRDLVLNVKNLQQLDMMSESGSKALGSNATLNSKASDESMEKKPKSDETVVPEEEDGADLHIIAHVSNLISVQIDHYQYLFLLRLSETMTELSTFLTIDANRILQKQTPNKSIVIGCVIPQVEVTLVMPSQTPGKESSGGDAESVVPDSASLGDDLHYNAATWQSSINLDHIKSTPCVNTNPFGSVETPSPINEMPAELVPQNTSNPNTHGHNVSIQSTPTLVSGGAIPRQQEIPSGSSSGSSSRRNRNSVSDGTFSKEINSSLISMKKGFTSFMTSIDSALKTNPNDDASDTFSIHSDISSDSENFIMVLDSDKTADCMDVMFRLNPFTNDNNIKVSPVEVASEVCEELPYKTNMSSPSEPSDACSWRRRDLVSMATFRLTTVELIRQNKGYDSSLKLQVSAISCNECGAIPWDELQTKFGARCRAWNVAPYNPEAPPIVQLRLEETLNPPENICAINDKNDIKGWFEHNVDVRVKDLNMDLTMSTIIGLGDLAEDEVITKPMPMSVLLENLKINLIEDRPPVNITSPGPVPINLAIGCLKMKRDATGIFQIQPVEIVNLNDGQIFENPVGGSKKMERDRELISLQLVMQQMKMDNENLKKQLVTSEQNSEICRTRGKQDSDMLRSYLKEAQDEIGTLLDEKRTLLDTVRSLQQQLVATERNIKNDGNR